MLRRGITALLACLLLIASITAPAHAGVPESISSLLFISPSIGWTSVGGSIVATSDGGRYWRSAYRGGQPIDQFDFVNRDTGWALGTSALLTTSDGGLHWSQLPEPSRPLADISFVTPRLGWGVERLGPYSQSDVPNFTGRLVRTSNAGRSWGLANRIAAHSVCFAGRRNGWVANGNAVLRTTDGGQTWKVSLHAPLYGGGKGWVAIVRCGLGGAWVWFAGTVGASDQDPYIAYSWIRGQWHAQFDEGYFAGLSYKVPGLLPPGPGNYPGPFVVLDAGTAWFLGRDSVRYGIGTLGTANAGRAWTRNLIRAIDPNDPLALSFVDPERGWVCGTARGRAVIYATVNGGRTWKPLYYF